MLPCKPCVSCLRGVKASLQLVSFSGSTVLRSLENFGEARSLRAPDAEGDN